jgi:hypothetical protein
MPRTDTQRHLIPQSARYDRSRRRRVFVRQSRLLAPCGARSSHHEGLAEHCRSCSSRPS